MCVTPAQSHVDAAHITERVDLTHVAVTCVEQPVQLGLAAARSAHEGECTHTPRILHTFTSNRPIETLSLVNLSMHLPPSSNPHSITALSSMVIEPSFNHCPVFNGHRTLIQSLPCLQWSSNLHSITALSSMTILRKCSLDFTLLLDFFLYYCIHA